MAREAPAPNFLGLKAPAPSRPVRVAVVGPKGPFFDLFLRASTQVELYDEELGVESYRRGIVTERVSPGTLHGRVAAHRQLGRMVIAAASPAPAQTAGKGTLLLAPSLPEEFRDAGGGRVTLAGWRRGRAPAGALSAREMEGGRGVEDLLPKGDPLHIVVDPHVMDPALFAGPDNVEPGGLTWYPLVGAVGEAFRRCEVDAFYLLPRPLGREGEASAFVLARLAARAAAHASLRPPARRRRTSSR